MSFCSFMAILTTLTKVSITKHKQFERPILISHYPTTFLNVKSTLLYKLDNANANEKLYKSPAITS